MGWLLNAVYLLAGVVAVPVAVWRYFVHGKKTVGCWQKFTGRVAIPASSDPTVWFHAVSVGEVNLLVSLLPKLRREWSGYRLVVSTTTWTGFQLAQQRFGAANSFFMPWDFTWSVAAALHRIHPVLLVLAELELWPNLMRAVAQRNVPVAIINGRLSDTSFRGYRKWNKIVRRSFERLTWVGTQNQEYAQRFAALGVETSRIQVTGNLKFDGARTDRRNPATEQMRRLVRFPDGARIWLAGSTQDPEEEIVIDAFRRVRAKHPHLRLIVAPRHPERCAAIIELLQANGLRGIRRTDLSDRTAISTDDVLIIDTVGELAAWWGLADIAYVGGSLGNRGGQNMIEPAAYGCAVSFGPNTKNFRDVVALMLARDAAVVVNDADGLSHFVTRCLDDPPWSEHLGLRASELVRSQTGASDTTIQALTALLPHDTLGEQRQTPGRKKSA